MRTLLRSSPFVNAHTLVCLSLVLLTSVSSEAAGGLEIADRFPTFSSRQMLTTQPLSVRFSSSLDPQTVNGSTFFVTIRGEEAHVPGALALESTALPNDTVVFTPTEPWAWGTRHEIHIEAALQDVSGSAFDGVFPDGPLFVANIPNDFEIPVYDPEDPFAMMTASSVLMGYNPIDPEGACAGPHEVPGLNITGAWKYTLGSPDILVAVIDDGIASYANRHLRTAFFINSGELPLPLDGENPCADHDCNGDGRFDVDDYGADPRVLAVSGSRPVDVGHLLEVFSDGADDDGNGLADDISGWDFFRDTNEVLGVSEFPEGVHGRGECELIAAAGNDGDGSVPGICPKCRLMMVRTSQQVMYDYSLVAAGVRYGLSMGADLINFAGVAYAYSESHHDAFVEAYEAGALTVAPSGDEMGMHHWWPAAGEDVISVKTIFPMVPVELWEGGIDLGLFGFTETFCTNYGTHVLASIPAITGCTSDSTGNTTGILALILSWAQERGYTLSAEEVRQILIASCDDIKDHCFSVPMLFGECQEGYDLHFGYGRPDAERALLMLGDPDQGIEARIPPAVRITEPRWWETVDPAETPELVVRGRVDARVRPFDYEVQIARGPEPLDGAFVTVCAESASAPVEGELCTIGLGALFDVDEVSGTPSDQFDFEVTLRVRAFYEIEGDVVMGEARKSISVHIDDDPETGLIQGFPIDVGASGEASPILYDMDGAADGRLEIVLATSDGWVHVLGYDEGSGGWGPLPGFPVDVGGLDPFVQGAVHGSPAVGDLLGDGIPRIVVATLQGELYAIHPEGNFHESGSPFLSGFPVSADPCANDSSLVYGHGNAFMASPVLADLDGDGFLEIVAGATDQKVYAWRPEDRDGDGAADRLPGWPVFVKSEPGWVPECAVCENDLPSQVVATPAVGIIAPWSSDPHIRDHPVVVVPTTEVCGNAPQSTSRVYAIYHDGTEHPGGPFLPGWPAKPNAPLGDALPLPMAIGSSLPPVVAVGESATRIGVASTAFFPQIIHTDGEDVWLQTTLPGLNAMSMAYGALSSLRGDGTLSLLFPTIGVINFGDEGIHLLHFKIAEVALDEPATLVSAHSVEDMPIMVGPVTADLDNDGASEVISGGGGYLVHAFRADGSEAPGWPKYTQKWITSSPAVGDLDGDGLFEVVAMTHEGFVYGWETAGTACTGGRPGSDWRRFQHDERNTGFYGVDVVPPGRIMDLEARIIDPGLVALSFSAPGDDWQCGRAARYEVRWSEDGADLGEPVLFVRANRAECGLQPGETGSRESILVEVRDTAVFAVRAVDEAGNLSRISNLASVVGMSADGSYGGCGCSHVPGGGDRLNLGILLLCALGFLARKSIVCVTK